METFLLVLLAIIVTALIVWNLPRLRAQAATRRGRPRRGHTAQAATRRRRPRRDRTAPPPDQMAAAQHVPDDDELRMRAQAHREGAALHQRQAAEMHHGAAPAAPPVAPPPDPYDERY